MPSADGHAFAFTEPPASNTARPAWEALVDVLRQATDNRVTVMDIYDQLAAPPYGIRAGVAPILLLSALLVHTEEVAVYEHGTFRPALTADLCERLLRNPANFEVKHFASRRGHRAALLTVLADRLDVTASRGPRTGRVGSVLAVVSNLLTVVTAAPEHIKKTAHLSADAVAVRRELLAATEPDELLFRAVPRALNKPPVRASGNYDAHDLEEIAERTAAVADELRTAYPRLLADIRTALHDELRGPATDLHDRLAARARDIDGKVIDPRVSRLVTALGADIPGDDEWAEYVAMNVTDTPPASWTDQDRARFYSMLHDIGGTFRRIEALHAELRSRGDGFEALRVTVTRPDGTETAKLVWVDEARRQAIDLILSAALGRARELAGSKAEAHDLLLAVLGDGDLTTTQQSDPEIGVTPMPYSRTTDESRAAR